jgi:hypothetical protein
MLRILLFAVILTGSQRVEALGTITDVRVQDGLVTVQFEDNPGIYYLLEYSTDLLGWQPATMSLGIRSVVDIQNSPELGFFRAAPLSKYSPLDSDGDGIDDVYELNHRLNPLDPTDGTSLAPDGSGLTVYQTYLKLFGIQSYKILQRESREWSIFNFGSGMDFEAVTREASVFNFGSPSATFEATSRTVSLYNGQAVPVSDLLQRESREWSLFNFGGPSAAIEAISHPVSVFNGQAVPSSDLLQRESREWSLFNFGSPSAALEAISREISVLNFSEN